MKRVSTKKRLTVLGLLLCVASPAWTDTVWCNFNDPSVTWIGLEGVGAIWREGDSAGSADVIDGKVLLTGDNRNFISGSIIRYDDINDPLDGVANPYRPVDTSLTVEYTIPDFNSYRDFSLTEYPSLSLCMMTSQMTFFGVHRDSAGVWSVGAWFVYGTPSAWVTGELIPADATRVSIKVVRTGNTVNIYAAYNGQATTETPEGFLQEGEFHPALENYQLTSGEIGYYSIRIVMHGRDGYFIGSCFIDDVLISGPYIPKAHEFYNFDEPHGPDWPPLRVASTGTGGWVEAGDRLALSVTPVSGIYPPDYQWRFNGAPIGGATASTFVKDSLVPEDSGTYQCLVTNTQTQAKAEVLSSPVSILVLPAGSLPAAGIAALFIAFLICAAMGVVGLCRTFVTRKGR